MFQKNNFGRKVKKAKNNFEQLCELAGQIANDNSMSENEKTLVEAMVPLISSMDMISTALNSMTTWTRHNLLLQRYVETKPVASLDDAVFLASCLSSAKYGRSDAATAMLIAANHLVNVTNETSLEGLKKIAKLAIDVSGKGAADNAMEDLVISAATVGRNLSVDEIVSLAESFFN